MRQFGWELPSSAVILVLAWSAFFSTSVTAQSSQTLEFREPAGSNLADYLTALLGSAYEQIDVDIRYVDMPRARSLVEANNGRIAGEAARLPDLESDYPNLIRVDFPLYAFDIILLADRRVCGICDFASLTNVGYVNGVRKVEQFLESRSNAPSVVTARDNKQLFSLLESGRIHAVLTTNFDLQVSNLTDNRFFITQYLQRETAYHYLHKKHSDIAKKLQAQLQRMHDNGEMSELATRYNIRPTKMYEPLTETESIKVIAGQWTDLTEADGSGIYFDLMKAIFEPITKDLELNASTFQRANQSLREKRYDVMLGNYQGQEPEGTISSHTHFHWDIPVYAITKNQADMDALLAGTLDRPVCVVRGYNYQEFLPEGIDYYGAESSLDCFAMLDLGRVGAVTDYRENVPEWIEGPFVEHKLHDGLPLHVAFQDTERGQRLRAYYEQRLREIIRSGEISQYYPQTSIDRSHFDASIRPQSSVAATPRN